MESSEELKNLRFAVRWCLGLVITLMLVVVGLVLFCVDINEKLKDALVQVTQDVEQRKDYAERMWYRLDGMGRNVGVLEAEAIQMKSQVSAIRSMVVDTPSIDRQINRVLEERGIVLVESHLAVMQEQISSLKSQMVSQLDVRILKGNIEAEVRSLSGDISNIKSVLKIW